MKDLRNYCLGLLGRREYTKSNLRKKLQGKFSEVSLNDINNLIEELENRGFVSDERFTEIFVRQKRQTGWGDSKIKLNLSQKGVSAEIIEKELQNKEVDKEIIKHLIERKFQRKKENLPKKELKEKIYRFLFSRGFAFSDFKDIEFFLE